MAHRAFAAGLGEGHRVIATVDISHVQHIHDLSGKEQALYSLYSVSQTVRDISQWLFPENN